MKTEHGRQIEFSQPIRQIVMMVVVLALVGTGVYFLQGPIQQVFYANPYLNGFIAGVFAVGVLACFWQVTTLIAAVSWLEGFAIDRPGHEFVEPPRLLVSLSALLRDRRARAALTATSARSILDTVATRLDEMRDITRYIANLLILIGLLGTFWGLSNVVPGIVDTMRSLSPQDGEGSMEVFNNLMAGLNDQLEGMATAFASSLLGLAGSLVVGLLDLFAGHGQNRFYRELEEWLSSITRISLAGEEGGAGAGALALELAERSAEQVQELAALMREAEERRAQAESGVAQLAESVRQLAMRMGEDHEALAALARRGADEEGARRLDRIAAAQERIAQLLERRAEGEDALEADAEARLRLRNIDMQLMRLLEEVSAGRQDAVAEIRMDLARLTRALTGETGER
ncbi:biopolymer transporter ExbB [Oceanicella actignis]|uniref:Biopolymer transporter ExbB n=1 Tax=Oceanicella actignis TaxID=1189325 RepID=A0A1M7TN35_9RHOB|nr:biopolymer transporter ExbB [Oceanicella actignis]SET72135.1 hypothetical protein SAMN04488119_10839 [Oceanicella actignis]SHN72154.1 hypothetical protein SAMN05216200_10840 [Oceanicella actignis]